MKHFYLLIITVSIIFFGLCAPKSFVFANSVCSGSPACVYVYTNYCWTRTFECALYPGGPLNGTCTDQQCEMRPGICSIPQSGGGSCTCCWNDGCYYSCPGAPTPAPGNGDPPADPTPEAGTCQNMYYCRTSDYSCQLTSSQYENSGTYPLCGSSSPTCAQNLNTNLPGQTTGQCYTSAGLCATSCVRPPGSVRIRAAMVPSGTNTCAAVQSSTNFTPVDIILFSDASSKTTSSDGTYASATWANSSAETKWFQDYPPTDYVLAMACYNTTSQPALTSGNTATLNSGETLTWQLGYTAGVGWFQAQGGDVYAATQLRSFIPASAVGGRYFVKDGNTGGTPGVVTFGTSADFDTTSGNGYGYVSTKNWLVTETQDSSDYYAIMYHRFGSPTTADYPGGTTFTSKIASRAEPYYVGGDLIVDTADWTVGNGETITVLVNGDLLLNKKINITGTGFVSFIVNGDITVNSSVGTTSTSSTPVIEGIYITSPAGTFRTGSSTSAAARRFVGKGTFVAGTFALERDLDADTHNIDYAADLFIYNPELMLRMPDKMKDMPVSWQEVAP